MTAAGAADPTLEANRRFVDDTLARLRHRVRGAVAVRQATDPDPGDPFRGLYVSDDQAVRLTESRPSLHAGDDERLVAWAGSAETGSGPDGGPIRLRSLARTFALSPLECDLLVVALGPDLDPRLEPAYGYLHDDVSRRRASVGLALELSGCDLLDAHARERLSHAGPLVAGGLIEVHDADRPFLTRSLRVPDEVVAFVVGSAVTDRRLTALRTQAIVDPSLDVEPLRRAVAAGVRLVYVRDRPGSAAWSYAATGCAACGAAPGAVAGEALALDLGRLPPGADARELIEAAVLHSRLWGTALIAGPVEALVEQDPPALRALAESGVLTVLIGGRAWDPGWAAGVPLLVRPAALTHTFHADLPFRLTPEQSLLARRAAQAQAQADGTEVTVAHLAAGARSQNAGGLERLARRIEPVAGWDDLVVPDEVVGQLHEVVGRLRHRELVLDTWGLARGGARGRGVTALFAGDSGTGKTLAAEVVSRSLDLDLYVIDLASVVDKYIGETEKNLDRIFAEAERVNGVLLFDEADAIFGKRSEVQDARDRYANVEVAYLLQRMERFDGMAILTTNLRANIDEAFLRRIDVLVDFPLPSEEMRRRLWALHLPDELPADDVDLDFLARAFELTGGNIRNVAVAAAFAAAASSAGRVTMGDVVRATAREYRKLGRLCTASEFGEFHDLVGEPRRRG